MNEGNAHIIRFLLSQPGVKVETKNHIGGTPLQEATQISKEYVDLLLKSQKINSDAMNELNVPNITNMLVAIDNGDLPKIKDFVARSPFILFLREDAKRYTPAIYAARLGKRDIVEIFLRSGAPCNQWWEDKMLGRITLSTTAIYGGHKDLASFIKKYEEFFSAVEKDDSEALKGLIETGFFIDVRHQLEHYDKDSQTFHEISETVLHAAARKGSEIKILIEKGASLTATNSDYKTALDIARQMGHPNTIDILEAAQASSIIVE